MREENIYVLKSMRAIFTHHKSGLHDDDDVQTLEVLVVLCDYAVHSNI